MSILIFDYDGVIVDSFNIFMRCLKKASIKEGFNIIKNNNIFLNLFDENMYTGLAKLGVPEKAFNKILKNLENELLKEQKNLKLFKDVKNTLKQLHVDNKLIIITSNTTKNVKDFLKLHNLKNFEDILGADVGLSKIKKINFIKDKFGNNKYFYIGDTSGDVKEGKKTGVKTIAVTWGWHDREKLKKENPDIMIDSPKELITILNKK